jgi:hypothetical protein
MCNNSCNECPRKIYSSSVTIVTVDAVDTLVIDVPQQTFNNGQRGCIVITQNIPTAATINMPVAISIGGDTTTVYPLVTCNANDVTVPMIRTRRRYPFRVATNSVSASFVILKNLSCYTVDSLPSIPAVAETGG